MSTPLHRIMASTDVYISVSDAARILHCDPQCIRVQARTNPEMLGYPVIIIGRRVRIPRIPFLRYLGYPNIAGDSSNDMSTM